MLQLHLILVAAAGLSLGGLRALGVRFLGVIPARTATGRCRFKNFKFSFRSSLVISGHFWSPSVASQEGQNSRSHPKNLAETSNCDGRVKGSPRLLTQISIWFPWLHFSLAARFVLFAAGVTLS
jgi:hypothetical protein